MLKLMKYEFRKLRTALLAMLGLLVVLEAGFLFGVYREKPELTAVSLALISVLVFAAFAVFPDYFTKLTDLMRQAVHPAPVGDIIPAA